MARREPKRRPRDKRQKDTAPIPPPDWRGKALELLPELAEDITDALDPMGLWIVISSDFQRAYQEPRNEDFIRRVYAYANWCLLVEQPPTDDASEHLLTCVVVCFLEHLPCDPLTRADMPRWFTRAEVAHDRPILSYFLTDAEFEELLTLWDAPTRGKKARKR